MRLIDADALFKELNDENIPWNRQINDIIMAQPTAYDVDAVVEQLEEAMERYEDVSFFEMNTNGHTLDFEYSNGKKDGVEESIDIVRKGGNAR